MKTFSQLSIPRLCFLLDYFAPHTMLMFSASVVVPVCSVLFTSQREQSNGVEVGVVHM